MTASDWLSSTDPQAMLRHLGPDASPRKLRLFAVACCREIWHLLTDERSRAAVEVAERFVDGRVTQRSMEEAGTLAWRAKLDQVKINEVAFDAAWIATWIMPSLETYSAIWWSLGRPNTNRQAALARCIFPFAPIAIDPRWLTSNVVDLARCIYDERRFELMPILGDALMDAGCDEEKMIGHCRGDGPHTRGCWCVDLLTGRERER